MDHRTSTLDIIEKFARILPARSEYMIGYRLIRR